MVDRKGCFLDRGQDTVHGSSRFQPANAPTAQGWGNSVRTGGNAGSNIRSLVAEPITPAEALVKGRLDGEVTANPSDRDRLAIRAQRSASGPRSNCAMECRPYAAVPLRTYLESETR